MNLLSVWVGGCYELALVWVGGCRVLGLASARTRAQQQRACPLTCASSRARERTPCMQHFGLFHPPPPSALMRRTLSATGASRRTPTSWTRTTQTQVRG